MAVNPSSRSKISSFIVMDLLQAAAEKDKELEAAGAIQRVIHLEIGQPSTGAPKLVQTAAVKALEKDRLGYTEAFGVPPLRSQIAANYRKTSGVIVQPESIITTTGSSGAFVVGFIACFDPGMRVAMASPGYPCYRNILQALGVEVVQLEVTDDSNWQPTVGMLEAALRNGPLHGLIIASPSNPTGTVLSAEELKALCDFCTANSVRLISDEIYHGITLTRPATTALLFKPDAMIINSFSKYYSVVAVAQNSDRHQRPPRAVAELGLVALPSPQMTGWRLGWIVCQDIPLRQRLESLLQNLFISAPTLSQLAGVAAFECEEELERHVQRYKKNREVLVSRLPGCGFSRLSTPQGAFYLYCEVSNLLKLTGCGDSMQLATLILKNCAVAITPGLDFDPARGGKYIRFSFSGSTTDMHAACDRLQAWYTGLSTGSRKAAL